jgi:hypothetical protein
MLIVYLSGFDDCIVVVLLLDYCLISSYHDRMAAKKIHLPKSKPVKSLLSYLDHCMQVNLDLGKFALILATTWPNLYFLH